ncbi:MAG: carboxypeptidase-like regulatory domain-containing protein [Planctomycetota bacterium]
MSARAKTLILAPLALGAGLAVWFALPDGGGRSVQAETPLVARPAGRSDAVQPVPTEETAAEESADHEGAAGRVTVDVPQHQVTTSAGLTSWEEGFDGLALYGTLEDEEANPIEGAQLALYPRRGDYDELGAPLAECVSNAEGRFRFLDLEEFKEYRIYAQADGFLPRMQSRKTGVDDELTLRKAAPFAGKVVDAASGVPLEGVKISISNVLRDGDELMSRVESVSDAEGAYAIPFARLDSVQKLTVTQPGHLAEQREFQVLEGRPEGYDIELGSGRPMVLYVYDLDTGKPLADQELQVLSGYRATTDEHGEIRITSPAYERLKDGKLSFDVRLDGWCRTTRSVLMPEQGFNEPVELPLIKGARVTGRIHDEDGKAIHEAYVWVQNQNRRLEGVDLPDGAYVRSSASQVRSDESGHYELAGVLPGPKDVKLSAAHSEYPREYSDPFLLPTSAAVKEQDMELSRGAEVRGTITLNGEPAHARVWWRKDKASGNGQSNDSGAYRMRGVQPGMVKLSANVDDGFWSDDEHSEEVWVEEAKLTEHDIVMVKSRATIAGIVKDANGTALPGVQVNGWAEDEGRGDWYYAEDKTDAEGRFELAVNDSPGILYDLWAYEGQRNVNADDVPVGSQGIELVLPRTGKLRLEVVDLVTREHIQKFNLYWRKRDSNSGFRSLSQGGRDFSPGPDGFFEAELPIGNVDLRISARSQGYIPADLPNLIVVEDQIGQTALVELEHGVKVEFQFLAQTPGTKLSRLTVVNEDQRAELSSGRWSSFASREIHNAQRMRPNGEGKAVLKSLAPGTYSFWKPPKNHVFEPETFEVPHVENHMVEIQWRVEEKSAKKNDAGSASALETLGYF